MTAFNAFPLPFVSRTNPTRACTQTASSSTSRAAALQRPPPSQRAFWVEPCAQEALTAALEGGVEEFLFRSDADATRWSHLGRFTAHVVGEDGHFDGGVVCRVSSAADAAAVAALAGSQATVVLDERPADDPNAASDWRVIPAENVLAAFAGTPTRLFAVVHDAPAARAMLAVLETGVDGVVLRADDAAVVRDFLQVRDDALATALQERDATPDASARISAVVQVGAGMRVCVDTCSLLGEDEGVLVGSSSQRLFVVLSEAASCDYIASRPFRVNAGAVHSYIAIPGGRTRYLCELQGGDEVLVYNITTRKFRTAVVGRAKVESRPLTMIKATFGDDEQPATLFVQNAETVRLATMAEDGSVGISSVTQLQDGDHLLARTESVARHTGIAIEETIVEK